MNELDKIRLKSKNFTKMLVLEFTYCSFLFFGGYKILSIQLISFFWFYIFLLICFPFVFNTYFYLKSKKNLDLLESNNIIIVQILVLIFSFKFLI
jgi:hypothetical protein